MQHTTSTGRSTDKGREKKFQEISQRIIDDSNGEKPWIDYLGDISSVLLEFSGSSRIDLHIRANNQKNVCERIQCTKQKVVFDNIACVHSTLGGKSRGAETGPLSETSKIDSKSPIQEVEAPGAFKTLSECPEPGGAKRPCELELPPPYQSRSSIPIMVGRHRIGLLDLMFKSDMNAARTEIKLIKNFAQTLGLLLLSQRSQSALCERVKELTCLYAIAQAVEKYGPSYEKILKNTVKIIPKAWQYPDITQSRIVLDGKSYSTSGFKTGPYQKQTADIIVKGTKRGQVEVIYTKDKPCLDEGPFLTEERDLLNSIARELSLIIERKQSEQEEAKLQTQLRHADRLATIGQLASGVSHELNEPLCNILGFAQLAAKNPDSPEQVNQDLQKIIGASLHAREIVKKLLIFSRRMPTKKVKTDLNSLIKDSLYFLESRCQKEGIQLTYSFDEDMPGIVVDPAQITQVIVNMAVNAIQAMSEGGTLTIQTLTSRDHITLSVIDTGTGMDKNTLKQIFLPFFTTKDVGQGTGLGLAVAHGIVTSHNGSIKVTSRIGSGTRFDIEFPRHTQTG